MKRALVGMLAGLDPYICTTFRTTSHHNQRQVFTCHNQDVSCRSGFIRYICGLVLTARDVFPSPSSLPTAKPTLDHERYYIYTLYSCAWELSRSNTFVYVVSLCALRRLVRKITSRELEVFILGDGAARSVIRFRIRRYRKGSL